MEDPIPYRKPHSPNPGLSISAIYSNPITQGKSYLQFLLKGLFFVVLVMVLPLFPSQPPEFFNDTIFDKFWELIHLLFIGIAVSYGLFSRRNVEMGVDNCSNVENLESYMPRMFDGCDNPCGSGGKRVLESWNSQNFVVNNRSTVYFDARCKPRLLNYGYGVANSCGFKNKNVAQGWNSQYFQGESMVFVAQPDYAVDEIVKSKSVIDDEPLGLPIRSLKSRVKNQDKSEFGTWSESGFGSNAASNTFNWSWNRSYGDLAPINLLEKFNQAMASPSPILQRSSSRKLERGKRVGSATRPSHFRPLSVDEAQFESLKSRSFRSTLSFSSQTSSKSSSPEKEYSSVDSISSELLNSETVHLGKRKKSSRASSPLGLPSEPIPMKENVSGSGFHSRGYSTGSFFEEDLKRRSENHLKKELNGSRITGDQYDSEELGIGSFKSEKKPAVLTKSSTRGKSVRTIRGSRLTTHDKVENNQKMFDNGGSVFMRKEKVQNGRADNLSEMPKPAFPKYQKEQMQDFFDHVDVRSEEESESEVETFEVSSEDRVEAAAAAAFCNSVNVVAGPDFEVDKKASEFIAKFREQIRLQKVVSIDRSRGLSLSENRFSIFHTKHSFQSQETNNPMLFKSELETSQGRKWWLSHYEENMNRRLVVFLSATTTFFRIYLQQKQKLKVHLMKDAYWSKTSVYRKKIMYLKTSQVSLEKVMFHYVGYNESGRRIDSSYNQGAPARIRMFHYVGYNESGRCIDSSYNQGAPARIRMVPGFEEGIRDIKPGAKEEESFDQNLDHR